MKNHLIILSIAIFLCVIVPVEGEDYDNYVKDYYLNENECPLQIVDWNAWYRTDDDITFGWSDAIASPKHGNAPSVKEAGFQYDIRIKHNGNVEILAFQVNVVVFSAFEEYLDTFGIFQGAILKPGKDITRKQKAIYNGDNQFLTFFLWVDKVRDIDGKLYFADLESIKESIEKKTGFDIPLDYLKTEYVLEINSNTRFKDRVYVDVY